MAIPLIKYNPHWEKGFSYPYPLKRKVFGRVLPYLANRQVIEISGLRRVGKTTLLFQIVNHFLEQKTDRFHLLYFTFDEERPSLDNLLSEFDKQTGCEHKKEKVYLFLDEIQKLPNFQNQIKVYYDLYPNIKFFLSGSTSLFIHKKEQESLAGRVFAFHLHPLDFEEYLIFADKKDILEKPQAFASGLAKEFEIYLRSQFIESMSFKDLSLRNEYFVSIMKKIIFEDIPAIFPIEDPEVLWQIVKVLASYPGMIVDYQSLGSDLSISNKTVSTYLSFLEDAFLVKKLYNFSKNLSSSERKLKKYYLASPSFAAALNDFAQTGPLVENLVVSLRDYHFFWRDVYKNEVDFVHVKDEEIIPVEVKYTKEVKQKDLKPLFSFLQKFKVPEGRILVKNLTCEKFKKNNKTILTDPVYWTSFD